MVVHCRISWRPTWLTPSYNVLQGNQGHMIFFFFGPEGKTEKLLSKLKGLKPSQSVANLEVSFDLALSFSIHIKNATEEHSLVLPVALSGQHWDAFISCCLEFCNALHSGLHKKTTYDSQRLRNMCADKAHRMGSTLHQFQSRCSGSPLCFRINIMVLLSVFKCLNGLIWRALCIYQPSQLLRSSGTGLLIGPKA